MVCGRNMCQPVNIEGYMGDLLAAFTVWGEPKPKERPRFGRGRTYTPKKTEDAENAVIAAFKTECPQFTASIENLRLEIDFHRKGQRAVDLDNLVKLVQDALNGLLYVDDSQVAELAAARHHGAGDKARTDVRIYLLAEART